MGSRVALVADLHITERRDDSRATLDEQVALLKWIGDDAAGAGARAMLCAGDVFDSVSTPAERNAAIDVFTYWAERMPVVTVKGNHDRALDLQYLGRIRSRHSIDVSEHPDLLTVNGVVVATLPWPRKSSLVAQLGTSSQLEVANAVQAAMRSILLGFKVALAAETLPTVLLGHVELGGAILDNGQPVAGRCDVALSEADLLEVGTDAVLLGHIHLHQVLGGGRIVYPGSPRPTRFGEESAKGYCLVDLARGEAPVIEHRRAPYRELVTIVMQRTQLTHVWSYSPRPVSGRAVRLVYEAAEIERAVAASAADEIRSVLLVAGAHSVKLDPRVTTTHRVRSEEIRTAKTTADRLRALWSSRGEAPTRSESILAKLNDLEAA